MMLHLSIAIVVVLVALVGLSRAFLAAPTMLSRNHYPLALLPASKCCRLAATSKRDPSTEEPQKQGGGFFGAIGGFFEELDAFMDDASARRLGNGAAFYGKRRSNFYGEQDKNKKRDREVFDPTEDYQGPSSSGFFKWMPDEDGQMRPVTRMKNRVIEKRSWFSGPSNDE